MAVERETNTGQTAEPVPSGVRITALDEEFRRDPYPMLGILREREPVHYDDALKRYVLTHHDDVDAVLRDRTMFVDPRKAAPGTFDSMFMIGVADQEPSMLFLDAPDHTRLRGLVTKAFTPRAVEQMAPRIQQIVDELLDAVATQPRFDLIAAFAGPLPTIVIAEMLGIDPADRVDFKRWSDDGVMAFDPMLSDEGRAVVGAAMSAMRDYLQRAIEIRRADPRDDLISSLIAAEEAGDQLTDEEIVTMCGLLLSAGNVTTTDLIGNGVLALLRNPDEPRKLHADPLLIKNAVEEMLRFDSPVVQSGRIPSADVEIGGCPVPHAQSIVPLLAAANHDPDVYPDPDRFDITREDTHHHSFGGGAHYCLGAPLARLEAQIAIGTLVQRFPEMRLAEQELEWRKLPTFRGLVRMFVETAG